jgi:Amt family ammonium transporter
METIDIFWVIFCAGLVLMMQAGFLFLETGLTRSKNNANVAVKNLTDFCVSSLMFWAVGFGLMFGASNEGWVGASGFFIDHTAGDWSYATFFIFQLMFCGAAVTIISGAAAERMKLSSYIIMTILISGLIYPIGGHWSWATSFGGETKGFLAELGFYDFAGSTVVHSVGGWASLAVLLIIGPRLGRFDEEHKVKGFMPSNISLAAAGILFLFIGLLGFNGGSTLALNEQVGLILVNTILAAATGAVSAGVLAFGVTSRLDARQIMNGCLGGLVAVSAGANLFSSPLAILVGFIGGMVVVSTEELLEYFQITGLGRIEQIGAQLMGIAVYAVWAFGATYLILRMVNEVHQLRVTREEEIVGLNISEHGLVTEEQTPLMDVMSENKL